MKEFLRTPEPGKALTFGAFLKFFRLFLFDNMQQSVAKINWRMKGKYIKSCNCDTGCPCDFWAKPTHTKCEGMLAMEIDEGHFGRTSLNGVKFAATYHWPGPLHEGNGTIQAFIDEKATPEQREALLTILTGKAGNPWFEVIASLVSTLLEPKFVPCVLIPCHSGIPNSQFDLITETLIKSHGK